MSDPICTTFAHIPKTCIKKGVFYTYPSIDVIKQSLVNPNPIKF